MVWLGFLVPYEIPSFSFVSSLYKRTGISLCDNRSTETWTQMNTKGNEIGDMHPSLILGCSVKHIFLELGPTEHNQIYSGKLSLGCQVSFLF